MFFSEKQTFKMKINYNCLPCLVNQSVKVAEMVGVENKELLFSKVFELLSKIDFNKTNPEIIGETFQLLKEHSGNNDPYKEIRDYYNDVFMNLSEELSTEINSFEDAVKYSIIGNIIDFNPIHNNSLEKIMNVFETSKYKALVVDNLQELKNDLCGQKTLLYIGDNCGEICLDKILLKKIKELNNTLKIYFAVRGTSVVNDSIEEDAYKVGIDGFAEVISNGDNSLGTVLSRVSREFLDIYKKSDVIIAKGQANYESLSEENKNIYFLLMTKCDVIADDIGVPKNSMVCLKNINLK